MLLVLSELSKYYITINWEDFSWWLHISYFKELISNRTATLNKTFSKSHVDRDIYLSHNWRWEKTGKWYYINMYLLVCWFVCLSVSVRLSFRSNFRLSIQCSLWNSYFWISKMKNSLESFIVCLPKRHYNLSVQNGENCSSYHFSCCLYMFCRWWTM